MSNLDTGKTCIVCNTYFLNIDLNFYKHKQYYNSYCKKCHHSNIKKYKDNNPEKNKIWSKKSQEKETAARRKLIDDQRKQLLSNDFKFCKYCNQNKSKNCFSILKSSVDGFRTQCNDCRKIREKKTIKPYKDTWKQKLFQSAKKNSKLMNCSLEIDIEFIQHLYDSQSGLCFWSKVPILFVDDAKHPQKPSLDRKDNSKGYTKDNVVLTCFSMNFARNVNSFETFSEFMQVLKKALSTSGENE